MKFSSFMTNAGCNKCRISRKVAAATRYHKGATLVAMIHSHRFETIAADVSVSKRAAATPIELLWSEGFRFRVADADAANSVRYLEEAIP